MTFLAPWALAIGMLGSLGIVALHLVSHQRPAAYVLPTTRFIPDEQTLVSRFTSVPRDLLLLLLRVLLLLSAAAAFAKPVLTPGRGAVAKIVMVDVSASSADAGEAVRKARSVIGSDASSVLVAFDTSARIVSVSQLDSLVARDGRDSGRSLSGGQRSGSLSAALLAARRASVDLAERTDSLQLVLVSPVSAAEVDSATRRIRGAWPGGIQLERVARREVADTSWSIETAQPLTNAIGPALQHQSIKAAGAVRIVRKELVAADSVYARGGATVVRWDSTAATHAKAEGLSVDGDVVVAALERARIDTTGNVVARWADGSPAAVERPVGAGCIREVGVAVPAAGDLALGSMFQRIVRKLVRPCGLADAGVGADSAVMSWLRGSDVRAASASALRSSDDKRSSLARWLLAFALTCGIAELLVRKRTRPSEAA